MASLQELSDRSELERLVVDYAYAIDERAFARLDDIFTADAEIDYTAMGGIKGRYPQIRAWLPQALAMFPGYMHLMGNMRFDIDGDAARGRIACFNPMVLPKADGTAGEGETMLLGLWYDDRYVRTRDGWRISARSETYAYQLNAPEAVKKLIRRN